MNICKITSLFIIIMVLASCVSKAQQKHYSRAEQDKALEEMRECYMRESIRKDDRVSDAYTIARAVANACYKEAETLSMMGAVNSGLNRNAANHYIKLMRKDYPENALFIVLELRKDKGSK